MAARRIGIIGNGNVGTALERGLKRAGCTVFARHIDIQLGYGLKMGTDTGFKLMHGHAA